MHDEIAHLADQVHVVRDQDHAGLLQTLGENVAAFRFEARIAHGEDLVDQVVVEVERHARAEREPGSHAGRVRCDGFVKVTAELCEVFYVVELFAHPGATNAVNPADELDVVAPGERPLHAAHEPDGPRQAAVRHDLAGIRQIDGAQEAHERGLAGAVASDQSDVRAARDLERQVAKHDFPAAHRQIRLRELLETNHVVTLESQRKR